jgi:hypothetical protein
MPKLWPAPRSAQKRSGFSVCLETEELVKTEAVNAIQGAETTSNAGTGDSNALPKGGCLNSVSIVLGDSLLEVQRRRWYLFVSQLPRVLQRLQ